MPRSSLTAGLPEATQEHLDNVAANLQLVADLGYGDAALAVAGPDGDLTVVADARPSTAADPVADSRMGVRLDRGEEPEAYAALGEGRHVGGASRPGPAGSRSADAYPIGAPPVAVVLRTYGEQAQTTMSRMEAAFIASARDLLTTLRGGPLRDLRTGAPFSTSRTAGDGLLRVDHHGRVAYASPNAVAVMRLAGLDGRVTGMRAAELPGGSSAISPLGGAGAALASELEVAGRTLGYRALALEDAVLVLVEDLTEARRRERELEIKAATIREVHHRVKNNLQTIASLLRMQARRSDDEEVRRALTEATERAASMATVHDLLAHSDEECVDFSDVARRVVDLVRRGVVGDESAVTVRVSGATGPVEASTATSLALALTELVHNALEHAFAPGAAGTVEVRLRRDAGTGELVIAVADDGRGLAAGADPLRAGGLGFSIVRTLVEEDLRGSLAVASDGGTTVTARIPYPPAGKDAVDDGR